MRAERYRFATFRGMAPGEFIHSMNKLTSIVNFKQTENGLEMRDSHRVLDNVRMSDFLVPGRHNLMADYTGRLYYFLDKARVYQVGQIANCKNITGAYDYKSCFVGNSAGDAAGLGSAACYFGVRKPIIVRQHVDIATNTREDKRFLYALYDPNSGWVYDLMLAPANNAQRSALGLADRYVLSEHVISTDFLNSSQMRVKTASQHFTIDREYNILSRQATGSTGEAKGDFLIVGNQLRTLNNVLMYAHTSNISMAVQAGTSIIGIDAAHRIFVHRIGGATISNLTQADDLAVLAYRGRDLFVVISLNADWKIGWMLEAAGMGFVEANPQTELPVVLDWFASSPVEIPEIGGAGYGSFWTWNEDGAREIEFFALHGTGEVWLNQISEVSHTTFPMFDMIEEIAVAPDGFMQLLNQAVNAPIRPYFGQHPNFDFTYNVNVVKKEDFNFDVWTVYETPTSQFGIDNHVALHRNPLVSHNPVTQAGVAWKEWCAIPLPAPQFDVNIKHSVLVLGDYNIAGEYIMRSYATPHGDAMRQRTFPSTLSSDNLVVFNFFSGGVVQAFRQNLTAFVHKGSPVTTIDTLPDNGGTWRVVTNGYVAGTTEGGLAVGSVFGLRPNMKYSFRFNGRLVELAGQPPTGNVKVLLLDGSNVIAQVTQSLTNTDRRCSFDFTTKTTANLVYQIAIVLEVPDRQFLFRDLVLETANSFTEDFYWTIYDEIVGTSVSFRTINNMQAICFDNEVCFSIGGVISYDAGNKVATPDVLNVAASNAGFLIGTKQKVLLVSSVQEGSNMVSEAANYGLPHAYASDGQGDVIAWAGTAGIGIVVNGEMVNNGTEVEGLLADTLAVKIDSNRKRVYFLTQTNFLNNVFVEYMLDGVIRRQDFQSVIVFYDLQYRAWYAFGYSGVSIVNMQYCDTVDTCYGFATRLGTTDVVPVILEDKDNWDVPVMGHVCSREMGFGNPHLQKMLFRAILDNSSKREHTDVSKVNYWSVRALQNLTDVHQPEIISDTEVIGVDSNSCVINIGSNVYTAAISLTMTRIGHNANNPKLILKDLVLMIQDMPRLREHAW